VPSPLLASLAPSHPRRLSGWPNLSEPKSLRRQTFPAALGRDHELILYDWQQA
jgi:hypothetical protein